MFQLMTNYEIYAEMVGEAVKIVSTPTPVLHGPMQGKLRAPGYASVVRGNAQVYVVAVEQHTKAQHYRCTCYLFTAGQWTRVSREVLLDRMDVNAKNNVD